MPDLYPGNLHIANGFAAAMVVACQRYRSLRGEAGTLARIGGRFDETATDIYNRLESIGPAYAGGDVFAVAVAGAYGYAYPWALGRDDGTVGWAAGVLSGVAHRLGPLYARFTALDMLGDLGEGMSYPGHMVMRTAICHAVSAAWTVMLTAIGVGNLNGAVDAWWTEMNDVLAPWICDPP